MFFSSPDRENAMSLEYPIPRLPQPLTEEGLRNLMRERAYWDLKHPSSPLYQRLVAQGFAMLFPGKTKYDETGKAIDVSPLPPEAVAHQVAQVNREMDRLERSLNGSSFVARDPRDDGNRQPFDERPTGTREGAVHVQAHTRDGGKTEVADYWRARPGEGASEEQREPQPSPDRDSDSDNQIAEVGDSDLPEMANPIPGGRFRGDDGPPFGAGHFEANRTGIDGKNYPHRGVDIAAEPGQPVLSPASGTVEHIGDPYDKIKSPDKHGLYQSVTIRTADGHLVKIFYVKIDPSLQRGSSVQIGQPIGAAQDLSKIYPPKNGARMTNHVHVEVWKNGRVKNPTDAFRK